MARDEATLHEIEKRALQRLKDIGAAEIDNLADIQEYDLGHFLEFKKNIAVALGVEGGRAAGEIAKETLKQGFQLRIILAVRVLKTNDEKARRSASLPIVEAVIKALIFQNLNLTIDPLQMNSFRYRTNPDALQKGFIIWEILLESFLNYEKQDLEEYDDLNSIFVQYCLQDGTVPFKETVHAEDLIDNLQTELEENDENEEND